MLKITSLSKSYGTLPVLSDISIAMGKEEIVAIVGPSGCGKTTLLNIIAGLEKPDSGDVELGRSQVGYVFQEDRLFPWLTLEENIRIVGEKGNDREIAELVTLVGLSGFEKYRPADLSGGMRQRCSLARAYNYHCDLLLMDEPFKSLDYALRMEMLEGLMNIWRRRRNAVLLVTHEIDDALSVASRILVLGKRPAGVIDAFELGVTETPRHLDTGEYDAIRNAIIRQLTTRGK